MKKAVQAIGGVTLLAAASEALILHQIRLDPVRLAALIESMALLLSAFVSFTQAGFVRYLRERVQASPLTAVLLPFLLLAPYLILALGTGTFALSAFARLALYILVPALLLYPDRAVHRVRLNLRDVLAMAALAVPVPSGWLKGIWVWPQDIYVFRPITCVILACYCFLVLRKLDDVGFKLIWKRRDVSAALLNLLAYSIIAIPLGLTLNFLHPHRMAAISGANAGNWPVWNFLLLFAGIYLTVAIPEELLFRGILQNILTRTIKRGPRGAYGLLISSVTFGLAHLHHRPVPNWRYAIMATIAGIFYGNVYRTRERLCASALTHALVDTIWRFWF
jgi:membrane protease YdiL (CAAX protease family)